MKEKLRSIIFKVLPPVAAILLVFGVWVALCSFSDIPKNILPSPEAVWKAFWDDRELIFKHARVTLIETAIGLLIGIVLGFLSAAVMDRFIVVKKISYPLIIVSQTIPTIAIAPLLVLWLGFDMLPKIVLVVFIVFFPITVSLLEGFGSVDADTVNLMRSMGAGRLKTFRYVKIPAALGQFFAGLKISVSYAVVGAVISEMLGGTWGLGRYMTLVRKSNRDDKMFAVIIVISLLSLLLFWLTGVLQRITMPWEKVNEKRRKI